MAETNVMYDAKKRLFYISSDIDGDSMSKVCFDLLVTLQEDEEKESKEKDFERTPIKIYINSNGGCAYDMWTLISVISTSKTPIYTYCTGYACSAAFTIFLSGHKRFASKNATLMYHQVSRVMRGKYLDLKQTAEENDRIQSDLEKYVLERTKITREQIDEVREKKIDWYIHSEDFIRLGLVDEIV